MNRAPAAALLAILLAEPTLARPVDADAGAYRPHHHYRYHRYHYHHYSRHHSVRVRSDPPGIKWTEVPEGPTPEPAPAAKPKPSGSFVLVRTIPMPSTLPIFEPRHLLPPSLSAITPASARAYCIAHQLDCAP